LYRRARVSSGHSSLRIRLIASSVGVRKCRQEPKRRACTVVANIGRDELKAKIDQGEHFVLLEVLGPQYYRHSHLPGAIHLPPGKVDEMAPTLLPDKDAEIVLYCWDEE
jgi:Rhodanese-like domain